MSLRINTNVSALTAYQNLNKNQNALSSAIEKLSSGMRINKAADDAAGLSISQGLTSQINGLTQAVSNAQDGVNVAQIADGALGTSQAVLQRMRTLVVQAANSGTQGTSSLACHPAGTRLPEHPADNVAGSDQLRRQDPARRHLQRRVPGRRQRRPDDLAHPGTAVTAAALGVTRLAAGGAGSTLDVTGRRAVRRDDGAHRHRYGDRHGFHRAFEHRCDAESAHLHVEQSADRDHQRHRISVEPDRRRPRY